MDEILIRGSSLKKFRVEGDRRSAGFHRFSPGKEGAESRAIHSLHKREGRPKDFSFSSSAGVNLQLKVISRRQFPSNVRRGMKRF
jgi:hypothetical protein